MVSQADQWLHESNQALESSSLCARFQYRDSSREAHIQFLSMNEALQQKLDGLTTQPGVYKHKDDDDSVLYVGKAKNLRNRVRSYFHEGRRRSGRIRALVGKIADVEVIVTDTEAEALILENNLIKELKPRYNVNLRDDKTYPYICIKNERFPRVFPTRDVRQDGSKYFGPYTDVKSMNLLLDTIRDIFYLRTCKLALTEEKIQAGDYDPCLEFHIDNCKAPCIARQSEEDYDRTIEQVEELLNGHTKELESLLEDEMQQKAEAQEYEAAADLRDRLKALRKYAEKQKIVSQDFEDRDVFALHTDEEADVACGVIFKVREGKMIGRQHKYMRPIEHRLEEELMLALAEDFYAGAHFFPDEVLLSLDPNEAATEDTEPLKQLLREKKGRRVPLRVPQRGDKASLVRMAASNAKLLVGEWKVQKMKRGESHIPHSVKALQESLHLDDLPRRVEAFDISHLGGTGTVASCVVFRDGQPKKSDYRTFKIRDVDEGDDYEAMREVIRRRYRRIKNEDGPWPDLVVIDGGKGQLSSAVESLEETDTLGRFPVIGLAKRLEEVFRPGDSDPYHIAKDSSALQLLQKVRDEAHRFAVTFQRKQRKQKTLHSELLDISGIGPKTVQKLMREFGSAKRVEEADPSALEEVIGPAKTQKIRAYYANGKAAKREHE
jgi:excinuclease ABC subunit C